MKADEATKILETVHSRCSVEDYIHILNGLIEKTARKGENSVKLYEVRDPSKDIPEPSPLVADAVLEYFEDEGFHIDRDISYPGISWEWHDEAKLMRLQRLSLATVDAQIDNSIHLALDVVQKRIESAQRSGALVIILLVILPYFHFFWDAFAGQSPLTKSLNSSEYLLLDPEKPIPQMPRKFQKEQKKEAK